jgi:hypothetical protein
MSSLKHVLGYLLPSEKVKGTDGKCKKWTAKRGAVGFLECVPKYPKTNPLKGAIF